MLFYLDQPAVDDRTITGPVHFYFYIGEYTIIL